jgi:hypothetical protein
MRLKRYDVFISYSREDSALVDPFAAALRRHRYRVFFDVQSIVVGEQWKARLSRAISSSRICILCWSQNAQASEYVAYEYSRAEGLGTPVLPWLLDATSLPSMLELHGVTERDPTKAVARFLPRLGWPLSFRRSFQALSLVFLACVLGITYWVVQRPKPWEFSGRVVDSKTKYPVAGVEVEAEQRRVHAFTGQDGRYTLRLPPPKPKYIDLVFLKQGYEGEIPVNVSTDHPFDTDITKLADR